MSANRIINTNPDTLTNPQLMEYIGYLGGKCSMYDTRKELVAKFNELCASFSEREAETKQVASAQAAKALERRTRDDCPPRKTSKVEKALAETLADVSGILNTNSHALFTAKDSQRYYRQKNVEPVGRVRFKENIAEIGSPTQEKPEADVYVPNRRPNPVKVSNGTLDLLDLQSFDPLCTSKAQAGKPAAQYGYPSSYDARPAMAVGGALLSRTSLASTHKSESYDYETVGRSVPQQAAEHCADRAWTEDQWYAPTLMHDSDSPPQPQKNVPADQRGGRQPAVGPAGHDANYAVGAHPRDAYHTDGTNPKAGPAHAPLSLKMIAGSKAPADPWAGYDCVPVADAQDSEGGELAFEEEPQPHQRFGLRDAPPKGAVTRFPITHVRSAFTPVQQQRRPAQVSPADNEMSGGESSDSIAGENGRSFDIEEQAFNAHLYENAFPQRRGRGHGLSAHASLRDYVQRRYKIFALAFFALAFLSVLANIMASASVFPEVPLVSPLFGKALAVALRGEVPTESRFKTARVYASPDLPRGIFGVAPCPDNAVCSDGDVVSCDDFYRPSAAPDYSRRGDLLTLVLASLRVIGNRASVRYLAGSHTSRMAIEVPRMTRRLLCESTIDVTRDISSFLRSVSEDLQRRKGSLVCKGGFLRAVLFGRGVLERRAIEMHAASQKAYSSMLTSPKAARASALRYSPRLPLQETHAFAGYLRSNGLSSYIVDPATQNLYLFKADGVLETLADYVLHAAPELGSAMHDLPSTLHADGQESKAFYKKMQQELRLLNMDLELDVKAFAGRHLDAKGHLDASALRTDMEGNGYLVQQTLACTRVRSTNFPIYSALCYNAGLLKHLLLALLLTFWLVVYILLPRYAKNHAIRILRGQASGATQQETIQIITNCLMHQVMQGWPRQIQLIVWNRTLALLREEARIRQGRQNTFASSRRYKEHFDQYLTHDAVQKEVYAMGASY